MDCGACVLHLSNVTQMWCRPWSPLGVPAVLLGVLLGVSLGVLLSVLLGVTLGVLLGVLLTLGRQRGLWVSWHVIINQEYLYRLVVNTPTHTLHYRYVLRSDIGFFVMLHTRRNDARFIYDTICC